MKKATDLPISIKDTSDMVKARRLSKMRMSEIPTNGNFTFGRWIPDFYMSCVKVVSICIQKRHDDGSVSLREKIPASCLARVYAIRQDKKFQVANTERC